MPAGWPASWFPWFLAALYNMERRRDRTSCALVGITGALMILAGHPPGFQAGLTLGVLTYGFWMWQRRRAYLRGIAMLALALALTGAMSSLAWWPALQVSHHSYANESQRVAMEGLPLAAATSLFWPNLFCQLRGDYWLNRENPIFVHIYQSIAGFLIVAFFFLMPVAITSQ